MAFWDAYKASLKPIEVEEPIDRWLHRPLGYVIAKLFYPTPISADLVTVLAIVAGVAAGVLIAWPWFPLHMVAGGALVFLSTLLDCADGQLARMRKTSSPLGRMLDGVADSIVAAAVAGATLVGISRLWPEPLWLRVTVVCLGIATVVTSSLHTAMYDHYKNVWIAMTTATYREAEDSTVARARFEATKGDGGLFRRIAWPIYLYYVESQEQVAHRYDPETPAELTKLPPYSEANAAIYRKHLGGIWAYYRGFYGFGSLMIGLSVFNALDRADAFLVFRLVIMNGAFWLVLRPLQRRAARRAFDEIAARPAERPSIDDAPHAVSSL